MVVAKTNPRLGGVMVVFGAVIADPGAVGLLVIGIRGASMTMGMAGTVVGDAIIGMPGTVLPEREMPSRKSILALLFATAPDDRFEPLRSVRAPLGERRQGIFCVVAHDFEIGPIERPGAGDQFEKHDTEGVDVDSFVQVFLAITLLGRHVPHRPDDSGRVSAPLLGVRFFLRNAEVSHFDGAVFGAHEHIGGFQVTVNDSFRVRGGDAIYNLSKNRYDFGN